MTVTVVEHGARACFWRNTAISTSIAEPENCEGNTCQASSSGTFLLKHQREAALPPDDPELLGKPLFVCLRICSNLRYFQRNLRCNLRYN
jgi:hypothetical protein